jgi:hypothetical protein
LQLRKSMKLACSLVLLLMALNCYADASLKVSLLSDQVGNASDLGAINIPGVGEVSLIARRDGNQLVVHAEGPDGKIIGKAETVVGLKDTPIYVLTPGGLEKITIYWGAD